MKKLFALLLLLPVLASGQTFNQFKPANGILKGQTTTYVTTAAAIADIMALASGTCNASTFLLGTGACNNTLAATEPRLIFDQTGAGADLKDWDIDVASGVLAIRTRTDADAAGVNAIAITRGTTTAISNISVGNATNNPTFTFLGTGTVTFPGGGTWTGGSSITATGTANLGLVNLTSTTLPTNGITKASTNKIVFAANNTSVGGWDTGNLSVTTGILAPNLATSSAATTGTLCWTTGTGNINVDTTTTCLASTRRVKQEISSLDSGLSEVMKFRPVSYQLRPEYNPAHLGRQVGLISEEVGAIDDRLISRQADGSPLGVRYQQLTAVLVKAIQEQQHEISRLRADVKKIRGTH